MQSRENWLSVSNRKDSRPSDAALGMDTPICRRDMLNSTLLAAGGVLLNGIPPLNLAREEDWTGYGGVGDYASSNGNTYEVMTAGHKIRDGVFAHPTANPINTGETFDCIIVGGGISGLAAALFFQRETHGKSTCLILDNHPIFGGEAKRNEFVVDGQHLTIHQGSAACFPPLPNTFLSSFYDSIGIDWSQFQYQTWAGPNSPLQIETAPYGVGGPTSGFFFGAKFGHPEGVWVIDPWGRKLSGAPIPEKDKRELLNMHQPDVKPFSTHQFQPKEHGDPASRHLDSVTLEQLLNEKYGVSSETVRRYLSPIMGGGSGLGADVLSAYCEYAADVLLPWDYAKGAQMFPGGNAGMARQILKKLNPAALSGDDSMEAVCRARVNFSALDARKQSTRLRGGTTVVAVSHVGDPQKSNSVEVLYTKGSQLFKVKARRVVMAGGSWTTKHVVRDLPSQCKDAYAQFHRAPCLMANVAVRNWRFLYNLGLSECRWFEGIGNSMTMRKVARFGSDPSTISPDQPTVINLKILFSYPGLTLQQQVVRGRTELLSTSFREYERRIREQFAMLFSKSGFNPRKDIAGIILNRWGHAYLAPQPGFFFGKNGEPAPGEVIRNNPYGRIAFANSDLSGIMDHRMSIMEAQRAVKQLLGV